MNAIKAGGGEWGGKGGVSLPFISGFSCLSLSQHSFTPSRFASRAEQKVQEDIHSSDSSLLLIPILAMAHSCVSSLAFFLRCFHLILSANCRCVCHCFSLSLSYFSFLLSFFVFLCVLVPFFLRCSFLPSVGEEEIG